MKPWSHDISSVGQLVYVSAGLRWSSTCNLLATPFLRFCDTNNSYTGEAEVVCSQAKRISRPSWEVSKRLLFLHHGYCLCIFQILGIRICRISPSVFGGFSDCVLIEVSPRQPGFCLAEPMVIGCQKSGPPETHRTQLHPETSKNLGNFTLGNLQLYQLSVFRKFPKFSQPTFRHFQTCYLEWIPMDSCWFPKVCRTPLGPLHVCWDAQWRFSGSPCHMLWKMEYDSIEVTSLSLVFRLELHFLYNKGFRRMFQSI